MVGRVAIDVGIAEDCADDMEGREQCRPCVHDEDANALSRLCHQWTVFILVGVAIEHHVVRVAARQFVRIDRIGLAGGSCVSSFSCLLIDNLLLKLNVLYLSNLKEYLSSSTSVGTWVESPRAPRSSHTGLVLSVACSPHESLSYESANRCITLSWLQWPASSLENCTLDRGFVSDALCQITEQSRIGPGIRRVAASRAR